MTEQSKGGKGEDAQQDLCESWATHPSSNQVSLSTQAGGDGQLQALHTSGKKSSEYGQSERLMVLLALWT